MKFRPTLWPTVTVLPALAILLSLGVWQLYRMQWKTGLIEELQVRSAAPAITLPVDSRIPAADLLYRPVRITGRYIYDAELHLLNRVHNGKPGINLITPFVRSDGGPTLMVNRGWAPLDWNSRGGGPGTLDTPQIEVTGIVRPPSPPGWFTPANRPEKNEWYYIDLAAMAASVGVLPFVDYYVYATDEAPVPQTPTESKAPPAEEKAPGEAKAPAGPEAAAPSYPIPNTWEVMLPNNHLSYAITWFSLAAVLLVVYFAYHARHSASADSDDFD